MIMDTLTSLRAFCLVADLRSFSGAAERTGLSAAMVSKHVAHLERRVGTRLLNRTSRRVSLTETGALYLARIRPMIEALDEVEAQIGNVAVSPRGTLRVTAPVWAASGVMARAFAAYQARYPDVCLDLHLSGRMVNLVDDGFDLALRATQSDRLDPGLFARPLLDIAFHLFAAPSYIAKAGTPDSRAALVDHALLLYSGMNNAERLFAPEGGRTTRRGATNIRMRSESETMLLLAAREGTGIAFLPDHLASDDVAAGRLVRLLPDELDYSTMLYAVYPSRRHLSAKVRTFIDFLAASFAAG